MKASEILRKLADVIDSVEGGEMAQPEPQAAQPSMSVALAPVEPAQTAVTTFVPPLQAKIELLKKAVDVDSIYNQGDEIAQLKKSAGIHPVVADEAASDEPLDI